MKESLKSVALSAAAMLGLNKIAARATSGKLRILCYHGAWIGPGPCHGKTLFISPERFERRLALLRRGNFQVLDLAEALERLEVGDLPKRAVVITIDDGWYSTFSHMLPALEAARLPATLYACTGPIVRRRPVVPVLVDYVLTNARVSHLDLRVLTGSASRVFDLRDPDARASGHEMLCAILDDIEGDSWRKPLLAVGQRLGVDVASLLERRVFDTMSPAELQEAARRGLRIELHTHDHHFPVDDADAVISTIQRNRDSLEEIVGGEYRHFCYPSGVYSRNRFPDLNELGIASATTCEPGFADRGTPRLALPRILDGEIVSEPEFLAEVSGLIELRRRLTGVRGRDDRGAPGVAVDGSD